MNVSEQIMKLDLHFRIIKEEELTKKDSMWEFLRINLTD